MLVLGIDPSLRNWGMAIAEVGRDNEIKLIELKTVQPVLPTGKQVRQNSLDIEAAEQLFAATQKAARHVRAVFVEVPVGSQSARAMASYALCCGVLGSLRASGTRFFEVTAMEVKLAGAGSKTATKKQMIDWAVAAHPEGNWPYYTEKGQRLISEAKAEHAADAVAAIYAGLRSNQFQQLLPLMQAA